MYRSIYFLSNNFLQWQKIFQITQNTLRFGFKEWIPQSEHSVLHSQQCNNSQRRNVCRGNWSTCLRLDYFMTKQTDTMFGVSPFHDKTDWYYVWGFTISWQNTLILHICLGLDHFMTKQPDTMSWAWQFHDKTDWLYVCGLTISWHNRFTLCLGIDHFMT